MKLLYILKKETTPKLDKMIASHKNKAEVTIIDMRENKDYETIIDKVFENNKIITW